MTLMASSSLLCSMMILFLAVQCQEDLTIGSSAGTVETQYLTFDMSQYGPDGGVFSSPNFPNYYPQDTMMFYQFLALDGYRVQIEMDQFQIRGVTPQCTHDYLDVFINVTDFNLVDQMMIDDQLLHRFCGRNKPPLLVSFSTRLLLGFFTEDTQTERGFNGSFRFVSAQPYRKFLRNEPCDYLFNSSVAKRGEFFSSTYPGTYLPWQFCNYSFVALPGERIHIRFRDFRLFKTPNMHHCAVDLIRLYDDTLDPFELRRFISNFRQNQLVSPADVPTNRSDQRHITDLCGTYPMPLDVYSTGPRLLLYFIATHYAEFTPEEQRLVLDKSITFWRKGFYAEYEFSSSLTKLDFIGKSKANQYVSGTECDQTIKSFGQGSGHVHSPNWPQFYKPQTSCSTFLLGLDDRYALENVEIEFDQFDLDCHLASLVIYNASRVFAHRSRSSSSSPISPVFSNYYRQELDFKENLSFCGHFRPEGRFVSQNALLKLSFIPSDRLRAHVSSSLTIGGRFQARYKFVKSYHQVVADEYDGTTPTACNLSYYQSRAMSGRFEPPRSSENDYFANSNCTFNFYPLDEQSRLLIWYDYFNIVDDNHLHCSSDNLSYSLHAVNTSKSFLHPFIYCGYRNFPPPYLTGRSIDRFHVHFRSNDDTDAGLGFDGRYLFVNQSSALFSSTCRSPFDPVIDVEMKDQPSGNLSSDGYPENVICEWSYTTSRAHQFNLQLNLLEMEGTKTKDPLQGCQASVLRIFSEGRLDEFCGQQETIFYYLTNSNWFQLQFISLTRQSKEPLRGFQLSWTIVQVTSNLHPPPSTDDYFDCRKPSNQSNGTSFCIHRSLICDGYVHCQPLSSDDETSSECLQSLAVSSRWSLVTFLRRHLLLISIVAVLIVLVVAVSLIGRMLVLRKNNRPAKNLDSDDEDERDSTPIARMEPAVTTV